MKTKLSLLFIGYALKMLASWSDKKDVEQLIEELKKVESTSLKD